MSNFFTERIRWIITIISFFVMISSAVLLSRHAQQYDRQISELNADLSKNNFLMRSLWEEVLRGENKAHSTILYTLLRSLNQTEDLAALDQSYARFSTFEEEKPLSLDRLPVYLENVDKHTQQAINKIDALYIENLSLEKEMQQATQHRSFTVNIALFIQLFCLALITIFKDMR